MAGSHEPGHQPEKACGEVLSLGVSSVLQGWHPATVLPFIFRSPVGRRAHSSPLTALAVFHAAFGHLSAVAAMGSKHVSEREVKNTRCEGNHRGSFQPGGVHRMTPFGMWPRTRIDRPAKDETGRTAVIDPDWSHMWLTWSMTLLKSLTST